MNNYISQEEKEIVLKELCKIHSLNQYDIVSTSISFKKKNGEFTEERCITFGVKEKIPLEELPEKKRIPSTIVIGDKTYITDVRRMPEKFEKIDTYCYDSTSTYPGSSVALPTRQHRSIARPLSGGISIGVPNVANSGGSYTMYTGTMGGIAVDISDNKLVGVTNNHVIVPGDPVFPNTQIQKTQDMFFTSEETWGARASAYSNISIYQPSNADSYVLSNNAIGYNKRHYPYKSSATYGNDTFGVSANTIDGALIRFNNNNLVTLTGKSYLPLNAPFSNFPDFATSSEIDNFSINDPVFKPGRTTGPVGGDNQACRIRVTSSSTTTYLAVPAVSLNNTVYTVNVHYRDVMVFESPVDFVYPIASGDSGSFLYGCVNSTNPNTSAWKIIGLCFAGGTNLQGHSFGVAARIDNVASLLMLSAWRGQNLSSTPNVSSTIVLPYSTYSASLSVFYNNKTYWNMGRV